MLERYDANKDEMVELTQEYFDRINRQFGAMCLHYSKNSPENYKEFINTFNKGLDNA